MPNGSTLDDVGIVHMNGRTFDPLTGVFMQTDPMIQDPANMQNYNRYGYCFNNPMTCTDPSGLSGWTSFRNFTEDPFGIAGHIAHTQIGYELGSVAIGIVSAIYCTPAAAAACDGAGMAIWAGYAGQSFHDALKTGLISGLTAEAMYGVGSNWAQAGSSGATNYSVFMNTVGHAVVGCASSYAGGGSCESGALAGGFSAAWGNYGPGYAQANGSAGIVIQNTMIAAMVGGTASTIGGGKFGNGAMTGAAGYLFNYLLHGFDLSRSDGQKIVNDASDWKDTPYAPRGTSLAGIFATEGVGADCSGSTYKIYDQAGDPYDYKASSEFAAAANQPGFPFRQLGAGEALQPGDVILFNGHMSIFAGGDSNNTDQMWTARGTGRPYTEMLVKYWNTSPIGYYRYQKAGGG